MSWGDVQLVWARQLIAAFAAAGGEDILVCPGSRSTPLALAARVSGLRVTSIVDERTAGFYALGQARITGRPSLVICTSGSAVAHLLPAVVEARESGVPLVVVSANRPPELQEVGASQTTAHIGMLSSHALSVIETGLPDATDERLRAMMSRVARVVHLARSTPGPVHIDAPFRKPLEPAVWPPPPLAEVVVPRAPISSNAVAPEAIATLVEEIRSAQSGVILCGPLGSSRVVDERRAEAVRVLAAATGFTLLAETTSGLRDGIRATATGTPFRRADGFDHLFRSKAFRESTSVDVILQIGRAPVSSTTADWVKLHRDHTFHAVITDHGWHDAQHAADAMYVADITATLEALALALGPADAASGAWEAADEVVWDALLEQALEDGDRLTPLSVARVLSAGLPDTGALVVGNSLAVRDLDWFTPALPPSIAVVSQRGVAGIDGGFAGTFGVASRMGGRPVTALFGDVAALHDIGSLQLAPGFEDSSIVFVIVDNGGGRIFDLLPVAELRGGPDATDLFRTTPQLDLVRLLAGFDVEVWCADCVSSLSDALLAAWESHGVNVVVAHVEDDTADHRRAFARVGYRLGEWLEAGE